MYLFLLVGPQGSGKTTLAKEYEKNGYIRISQDDQGKDGHWEKFIEALNNGDPIVVDRINLTKKQRRRYINEARRKNYYTSIVVLYLNKDECRKRCNARTNHPSITNPQITDKALDYFFRTYVPVEDDEADEVIHKYEQESKIPAIVVDLDGTLCDIEHRRHHVRCDDPDWTAFFEGMSEDTPNDWCVQLINKFRDTHNIVFCSGRPDIYREVTEDWLKKYNIRYDGLFMRSGDSYAPDWMVKQNILDFELRPRYEILFVVDDRKQVVDMWRKNGLTVLQCDEGNF